MNDQNTSILGRSTTGLYHRMLQQINSTTSSNDDLEAGLVSVGMLVAILFLGLTMFLVNILVEKYCPGCCSVSSIRNVENIDTTDEGNAATSTMFPYSSEIREKYLDSALKSQEFCSSNNQSSLVDDIESGRGNSTLYSDVHMLGEDKNDAASGAPHNEIYENDEDDNDDDGNAPQCLICFETFVNGDAVTTHCALKSYHRHCIKEWLMKHDHCPYCRRLFFNTTATSAVEGTSITTLSTTQTTSTQTPSTTNNTQNSNNVRRNDDNSNVIIISNSTDTNPSSNDNMSR